MRVVDALPAIRSSRFDLPLTYDAASLELRVGDVIRAPLGTREVIAFVVSSPRDVAEPKQPLKAVAERLQVPRAFDEVGLHLARFVAERYCCTLGEALGAVVRADAVPHVRDSFVVAGTAPDPDRFPSIPPRLIRLIWGELHQGFTAEQLVRHPEARRAADRAALLRHLRALVRAKALERRRSLIEPRTSEYRVRVLEPAAGSVAGKKASALAALVRERPGMARSEAVLAGFSNAVIARAIAAGAIAERSVRPATERRGATETAALLTPTQEQRQALERIERALRIPEHPPVLLYGVTGSGKTLVYVEAIRRVLAAGGRAIVLVPEISLTPQTAQRFEAAFGDRVAVLHSALSDRERFDAWQACARGEIDVVVGARSAIFAPLPSVGLVVVDEAHDPSYKQESVPRYHAVAVAAERMRREGGLLVLGSATPSLESYAAARAGKLTLLELRERATAQPMPGVSVIDLRKEFESGNRGIFSNALVQALGERLARAEKSLLFVNRRGSAGAMVCRICGASPQCPRCSVALSVHRSERLLRCHYCDYQAAIPQRCPACGSENIRELGIGTERVVEEVARLFPAARVLRMDSDTTTRVGDHARILSEFATNGDVLVGTQMVAKGLDYPTVTLAAVVAADIGLNQPDFRAAERSFALIAQACGRSGRMRRGEAIVQTYAPDHPAIAFAARHDYEGFATAELHERELSGFPPAQRLAYLGVLGRSRARVIERAGEYAAMLRESRVGEVLGPAPYPIARVNEAWRYRVAVRTRKPAALRRVLRERILPKARADAATRLAVNIDP